jgi:serine/threonine-protein kinase
LVYAKVTGQYALPQPPQDPITLLSGHNHPGEPWGGPNCAWSVDCDETLMRTGG